MEAVPRLGVELFVACAATKFTDTAVVVVDVDSVAVAGVVDGVAVIAVAVAVMDFLCVWSDIATNILYC